MPTGNMKCFLEALRDEMAALRSRVRHRESLMLWRTLKSVFSLWQYKRYQAHEELLGARRDESTEELGRLRSDEEFICQSCWDSLNGSLLYGLIPWTKATPSGARCAKCGCELPEQAYHYPGDRMMGGLAAVGDVIRHDRATRTTKGDDDGDHD